MRCNKCKSKSCSDTDGWLVSVLILNRNWYIKRGFTYVWRWVSVAGGCIIRYMGSRSQKIVLVHIS